MTTPDLTRITGLLLTKALNGFPELTHHGERWSLSDQGDQHAILYRRDPATDEFFEVADVCLTVDVQPLPSVEEGVTA